MLRTCFKVPKPKKAPRRLENEGRVGRLKRLWRSQMKRSYVAKQGPLCQWCGRISEALEVHHKLKRGLGGKDEPENAIVLCNKCHRWAHESRENLETIRISPINLGGNLELDARS